MSGSRNTKQADVKPADGATPGGAQAGGIITPKTDAAPAAAPSNPPKDKGLLEQLVDGYIQQGVDELSEPSQPIKRPKTGWEVLGYGLGMSATGMMENPKTGIGVKTVVGRNQSNVSSKPSSAPAQQQQSNTGAAKPANGSGGGHNNGAKRKPKRRCELVPHNELQCDPGQEAHHVVPDFAYRLGTRRQPSLRPKDNPSLGEGLAICLSQAEHDRAHKFDNRYKGASNSTRNGSVAGTMTGKQAKSISASNVSKATGGEKKGGCSKKDLKDQLDKQTADDKVLRGDKDLRNFKKRDGAADAMNRTTRRR